MATKTNSKKAEWNPDSGIFEDSRKGIKFSTKRFGNQVWMVENLVVKDTRFFTAKQAQKALPKGWRIPTRSDVIELENYIGKTYGCTPVLALLAPQSSEEPWFYKYGHFTKQGISGFNWDNKSFWYMQDNGVLDSIEFKWFGLAMSDPAEERQESYGNCCIRAVWDGTPSNPDAKLEFEPQKKFETFVDSRDGNSYKTVKCGEQEWFAEELRFGNKAEGYNWPDFLTAIPEGWRIPTPKDFGKLYCHVAENYFVCENEIFEEITGVVDATGLALKEGRFWEISEWTKGSIVINSLTYLDLEKDHRPLRLMRDSSYSDEDNKCFREDLFTFCEGVACCIGKKPKEAGEEIYQLRLKQLQKIAAEHQAFGTFTDPRDGEVYKTVTINGVTWMAENLRYKCKGSYAYHDDESNAKRFGRLYTEDACCQGSMDADAIQTRTFQGVAPEGWHLASYAEWNELMDYATSLGLHRDELSEGPMLSDDGWETENEKYVLGGHNGDRAAYPVEMNVVDRLDIFGLNIKPTGYRNGENKYGALGKSTAYRLFIHREERIKSFGMRPEFWGIKAWDSEDGLPVRCIKNETYEEIFARCSRGVNAEFGEFTDERDGEKYRTVKVGNQVWMAENLRFKTSECQNYGYSCGYTWDDAVSGIAPKGWHIPSPEEFQTLWETIGDVSSKKLGLFDIDGFKNWYWTSNKEEPEEGDLNEFAFYGKFKKDRWGIDTIAISDFLSVRCIKDA